MRPGGASERRVLRLPAGYWKPVLAAAAVVVIVVQAGIIAYQARQAAPGPYVSLSGPKASRPQGARRLLVRLSADARWADVTALLAAHDLTIVGGPRGGILEIAASADAQVDEDLKALRASPLVSFAGAAS
jgi:hypothetical protein